jgi:threonine dehydratase/very-short-patch-repair endonuclease
VKNKIIPYNPKLKEYARQLLKNSTLAEVLMWKAIKNRALDVQFHRQVPMLDYIVDFYCHELMLAIEIDGNSHDYRYFEDLNRQNKLENVGVRFIRFADDDVKNNMFSVSMSLEERVNSLKTPLKSPQGDNHTEKIHSKLMKQTLIQTHIRIQPYIHKTPVLTSQLLNEKTGCNLFFKCENFQKMGAFKMRGAANAILSLNDEERQRGVVTHSSGNFAQAVSLAAQKLGAKAYIVMPKNAPQVKKDGVKTYEGEIIECESTPQAREATANRIKEEKGATFLHPSNQDEVIYGNSTAAMELLEECPELDVILTPVGGGGLIAGTALAAHYFSENCKVIGGEPMEADDAYRSLISGKIETNDSFHTVADGLRTHLGDRNFPIIQKYVEKIIRVEEDEIINAMRLIWERMKIIIEPSCAVPFAVVLKNKEEFKNKNVGIILSGGNVDVTNLPFG